MRLYLSSFRLGNHPDRLVALARGHMRAAVILNACDWMPPDDREVRVAQEIAALEGLGFAASELDLRRYAGAQAELAAALTGVGLLWVRGGNPFILRRTMIESGADDVIRALLACDALVYGGFSAGPVVLGPSLRGVELVDDPRLGGVESEDDEAWECLGVLPYAIAPHYRSDHPESAAVEELVGYYIDHKIPFRALRDGEVIVVDGVTEEVLR